MQGTLHYPVAKHFKLLRLLYILLTTHARIRKSYIYNVHTLRFEYTTGNIHKRTRVGCIIMLRVPTYIYIYDI